VRDLCRSRHLWNDENRAYAAAAMKVAEWDEAREMEVVKVKSKCQLQGLRRGGIVFRKR